MRHIHATSHIYTHTYTQKSSILDAWQRYNVFLFCSLSCHCEITPSIKYHIIKQNLEELPEKDLLLAFVGLERFPQRKY